MRGFHLPQATKHRAVNITLRTLHSSKCGAFDQNWTKLGATSPQHSHVTHPKSLSYDALDLHCNTIVDCFVLLDYFCYLFLLLAQILQQCLYSWINNLLQYFFLPFLYPLELSIHFLWTLEGLILQRLSPRLQDLLLPPNIFYLFLEAISFSNVGKPLRDW